VEKQLFDTYQLAADAQEDESAKRLRLSQRHWLKFRDSYAEFISLREIDAKKSQLALVNQKIDSNLTRMMELNALIKVR
ncbi:MAG TPA: lysozyme inhibitor LprI family protein, partial [Spongiibacteraceae bacterium]|nr:lysozyme inhibitor LprI family protein [Spongiibacteraceae bacterium]